MGRELEELHGAYRAAELELTLAGKAEQQAITDLRKHYAHSEDFHPLYSRVRWVTTYDTIQEHNKQSMRRSDCGYGLGAQTDSAIGDLSFRYEGRGGVGFELFWVREGRPDVSLGAISLPGFDVTLPNARIPDHVV